MFKAPTGAGMPSLATMLDDIPAPPEKIARHLGISLKTLQRYRKAESAPRAVMLALFWETRWGRQWAHADADYWATIHAGMARALERKNNELRKQIGQLEQELAYAGAAGVAANLPIWNVG